MFFILAKSLEIGAFIINQKIMKMRWNYPHNRKRAKNSCSSFIMWEQGKGRNNKKAEGMK